MPLAARAVRLFIAGIAAVALGGCATLAPPRTPQTASCRALFEQQDAAITRSGVRDAGTAAVPGYPYLRADRFLASFASATMDDVEFADWVDQLRHRDLTSRAAELRNLESADRASRNLDAATRCGEQLARLELQTPAQRTRLKQHVHVDDDYSVIARAFGLYPLAVPFLKAGIHRYHEQVHRDYATPLSALSSPGPLVLWFPEGNDPNAEPPVPERVPRDALGIPQWSAAQWQALTLRHAPQWWIETGSAADRIGMPTWTASGTPTVDSSRPVVYVRTGFTRFGSQILPELVYVAWFSERPPQGRAHDPYAGALDGLIWRVVLDPQGRPLHYDSIHPCGCYRYSFPAQALQPRGDDRFWQEAPLRPQPQLPTPPLALRVQSGTHYLRRVVAADPAAQQRREYRLLPYEALLNLPDGKGGTRSLFGPDGIVAGSQRSERWWLWVSGVPDPGAMREWGTEATAFVGRRHFDDARFLEQLYDIPDWAR